MPVLRRYRTIWISDVHLGTRASKANGVIDFLEHHKAERYYLVGDIVDGWALQRSWYWPSSHNELLQILLERAGEAEMIYIPGNHDEAARQFPGLQLGGITIRSNVIHTTADGQRLLVLHGDEFDGVVRHARWLSKLGGWAYQTLLTLNRHVNRVRRWMNKPYWSLAAAAKTTTKRAVQYIADFEQAVVQRVQREDVDGVICGHIHVPELRPIDGVTYANTGDWVENCTALVEHMDGRLALQQWTPVPEGASSPPHAAGTAGDGAPKNDWSPSPQIGASA
ncbi:UDP-2,3-diacylglucosamine hydrolase [Salinibacter sp. 10B]|uniref:UDP-2,3-diacylglucosamine diphosphatase n=1 Tax=Salinibacter sp. 10B TaxID=1923971 RepID=UPI000CF51688|nr:UDP-2,3-diacylglucosamine diphosphatase [Salinibacter sp. 10B]PQJ34251.1 UDP-2,3-diacylglucosamine hydrolase [Salinibacter sp. 10B]